MKRKRSVMFAHELESFSPVLALMKEAGAPLTRDEYLSVNFLGNVPNDVPEDVDETFPVQFRFSTLLDTPPVSERIQ